MNNYEVYQKHYPREFSLEFKFAKFKFRFLLYFKKCLNASVYCDFKNQNSFVFNSVNLTNLSQDAELNSLCIFIR